MTYIPNPPQYGGSGNYGLVCGHGSSARQCLVCELEAENARLRAALEKILKVNSGPQWLDAMDIAEKALRGEEPKP